MLPAGSFRFSLVRSTHDTRHTHQHTQAGLVSHCPPDFLSRLLQRRLADQRAPFLTKLVPGKHPEQKSMKPIESSACQPSQRRALNYSAFAAAAQPPHGEAQLQTTKRMMSEEAMLEPMWMRVRIASHGGIVWCSAKLHFFRSHFSFHTLMGDNRATCHTNTDSAFTNIVYFRCVGLLFT